MKKTNVTFVRQGVNCTGHADYFEQEDLPEIIKVYFSWKELNEIYTKYDMRRANFPELLSEGLTSLLFGYGRTNGSTINGLPSSSMDLIDIDSGDMIQLKSCSTDGVHDPGPTSFGPSSEFDRLLFMHMDCVNDTAYWYELESNEYKNWQVNRRETIGDQQAQGRRPRVTILPKVRQANLKPIKSFSFSEKEA